jgi:hypothetical protein
MSAPTRGLGSTGMPWPTHTCRANKIAIIHIAHGCSIAERHGGLPPATLLPVHQAIGQLSGGTRGPGGSDIAGHPVPPTRTGGFGPTPPAPR